MKTINYKHRRKEIHGNLADGLKAIDLGFSPIDYIKDSMEMLLEKAEWPKRNDRFWVIKGWGEVIETMWLGCGWDKDNKAFGNCFRTEKEAIKARDKIREVLKK